MAKNTQDTTPVKTRNSNLTPRAKHPPLSRRTGNQRTWTGNGNYMTGISLKGLRHLFRKRRFVHNLNAGTISYEKTKAMSVKSDG